MKELSNAEKQLVFQMENWATYRYGDGTLMSYNSVSGRVEPVKSFNLDSFIYFDALLLFGGYVRPAKYAAVIMHCFESRFGFYPELLLVGGAPNKGQQTTRPENENYEDILIQFGFPDYVVKKNHIECTSRTTKENVSEIVRAVKGSDRLNGLERPKIAVVTNSGYSLRAAQELCFMLPEYEFIFFETPIASEEERLFNVELYNGYYVDIILASCWHSLNRDSWYNERLELSEYKLRYAPTYDDLRKLAAKGYTYYMYDNMLHQLGFSSDESYKLRNQRKIEINGIDLDGNKVGDGLSGGTEIFRPDLVKRFIEQTSEEFIRKGIAIG